MYMGKITLYTQAAYRIILVYASRCSSHWPGEKSTPNFEVKSLFADIISLDYYRMLSRLV